MGYETTENHSFPMEEANWSGGPLNDASMGEEHEQGGTKVGER